MKKNRLIALLLALPLLLMLGCFRQDIRTIIVQVPMMKTADCSKTIQDALGRIEGIMSAEPNMEQHTMSVTFDDHKLAIRNIQYLIAGLGFDADDLKAKPEAKASLPEGCR